MDAELIAAVVVIGIVATSMILTGASPRFTLVVVVLSATAVAGTELLWELLITSDS